MSFANLWRICLWVGAALVDVNPKTAACELSKAVGEASV